MGYKINIFCALLLICIGASVFNIKASYAIENQEGEALLSKEKKRDSFDINKIQSLFFTYWQHRAIKDALRDKEKGGVVRAPTQAELDALDSDVKKDPGPRDVSLGGIVFTTKDDWVIWLNGKRVMPDAVPKEILDLRVFKNYIEVKWLDEYTNQIFPLRLRTHQRFNMDRKIFLPG